MLFRSGPEGQAVGFAAEILREIAQGAGVRFEPHLGWWKDHLADFRAGRIEVLCGVSPDEEDYEWMDASISLVTVHAVAFTMAPGLRVEKLADLAGRRIGVMGSSASLSSLRRKPPPGSTLLVLGSMREAVGALESGRCDVLISNNLAGGGFEIGRAHV